MAYYLLRYHFSENSATLFLKESQSVFVVFSYLLHCGVGWGRVKRYAFMVFIVCKHNWNIIELWPCKNYESWTRYKLPKLNMTFWQLLFKIYYRRDWKNNEDYFRCGFTTDETLFLLADSHPSVLSDELIWHFTVTPDIIKQSHC